MVKNNKAVGWDFYNKWVCIGCNKIDTYTYRKLQRCKAPWYCKNYLKTQCLLVESQTKLMKKELISPILKEYFSDDKIQITEEFEKFNNTYTLKELNNLFSKNVFKHIITTFSPWEISIFYKQS